MSCKDTFHAKSTETFTDTIGKIREAHLQAELDAVKILTEAGHPNPDFEVYMDTHFGKKNAPASPTPKFNPNWRP